MRSSLLSKLRRQGPKDLLGSLSVAVPAISAVAVPSTTASVAVTRRGPVVSGGEIHAAPIAPIPVLAELHTAMCTAGLACHLPRSLDIAVVEDGLGELDAGEQHRLVDAGDSGHVVAYRRTFVLIETSVLVLTATLEGESQFGIREILLFLFCFTGETFGDAGVEFEFAG